MTSRAGQPAEPRDLVDVAALVTAYYTGHPDPADRRAAGRVRHLRAPRLVAERRRSTRTTSSPPPRRSASTARAQGYDGPLFLGRDTHAPLRAGVVDRARGARRQRRRRCSSTPRRLHADPGGVARDPARTTAGARPAAASPTASSSRRRTTRPATAASSTTRRTAARPTPTSPAWIAGPRQRAPRRRPRRRTAGPVRAGPRGGDRGRTTSSARYVDDLPHVRRPRRDPRAPACGSAPTRSAARASTTGARSRERHRLDLTVVNPLVDPTWRFMTLDWDGKIRMDCSSPYAMASLIAPQGPTTTIATGNDADADRHGIVTPDGGLMNPNHYLAVAIDYLFGAHRPGWPRRRRIGKTLVSSSMIDRVAAAPRPARWWRCRSASSGSCRGCSTARSASAARSRPGASFLRRDGSVWTTDKDGLILLACSPRRSSPCTGARPREHYADLVAALRRPGVRPDRRARRPRAEGRARRALPRAT